MTQGDQRPSLDRPRRQAKCTEVGYKRSGEPIDEGRWQSWDDLKPAPEMRPDSRTVVIACANDVGGTFVRFTAAR